MSKPGAAPTGANGRPQVWTGTGWEDESVGFAAAADRSQRKRTQSLRAQERDKSNDLEDVDMSFLEDDSGDDSPRPGKKAAAAKAAAASRKQALPALEQKTQISVAMPAGFNTYEDFVPLRDLKGAAASEVVGRRIRAWYEPEPGAEGDGMTVSVGVVTYWDPAGRMFALYDGEEEVDGLYIDGRDDFEWVTPDGPDAAQPAALPVPGCWRPGLEAGDVDKIYLMRAAGGAGGTGGAGGAGCDGRSVDFFVKWKGLSHTHCQWVPRMELEVDAMNKRRVAKFVKQRADALADARALGGVAHERLDEPGAVTDGDGQLVDEADGLPFNAEFIEADRIIAERPSPFGAPPELLVKWRALSYAQVTWESCAHTGKQSRHAARDACERMRAQCHVRARERVRARVDMGVGVCVRVRVWTRGAGRTLLNHQSAIRAFRQRQKPPSADEISVALSAYRPPAANFRPLAESPCYAHGHSLRPHQLEGLNWLLFSWYSRRSVMLADEMCVPRRTRAVVCSLSSAFSPRTCVLFPRTRVLSRDSHAAISLHRPRPATVAVARACTCAGGSARLRRRLR
jgi:hypothetical protein